MSREGVGRKLVTSEMWKSSTSLSTLSRIFPLQWRAPILPIPQSSLPVKFSSASLQWSVTNTSLSWYPSEVSPHLPHHHQRTEDYCFSPSSLRSPLSPCDSPPSPSPPAVAAAAAAASSSCWSWPWCLGTYLKSAFLASWKLFCHLLVASLLQLK